MAYIEINRKNKSKDLAPARLQWYPVVKRIIDLFICFTSLPIVFILTTLISILIVFDSPGSPFFLQERVGKDGRRFRIYKFRTMRRDYDDEADRAFMQDFVSGRIFLSASSPGKSIYKPSTTEHISRVGKLLRKMSLDELPQVLNVILGDMSLVGPRPNVPWEVEKYHDQHYQRLAVLPGITGLAQIRGRSSITFEEIVRHDLEYIQNQSLKLDLQILWATVMSVLSMKGSG